MFENAFTDKCLPHLDHLRSRTISTRLVYRPFDEATPTAAVLVGMHVDSVIAGGERGHYTCVSRERKGKQQSLKICTYNYTKCERETERFVYSEYLGLKGLQICSRLVLLLSHYNS